MHTELIYNPHTAKCARLLESLRSVSFCRCAALSAKSIHLFGERTTRALFSSCDNYIPIKCILLFEEAMRQKHEKKVDPDGKERR